MSRIRTVKPELFKHEELFKAEINSNLPLRLAFTGLFTCCDREGRFKWRAGRLKLDVLPYDKVDMAAVLDQLAYYGFIKKYEHQGQWYGYIPTWSKHQKINNRETASDIPAPSIPTTTTILEPTITNDNPIAIQASDVPPIAAQTVTLTSKLASHDPTIDPAAPNLPQLYDVQAAVKKIFEHWKTVMNHPNAQLDSKRQLIIKKALTLGYNTTTICHAITGCSLTPHNIGDNEQGQRYDGLHIILRDADQIERFIYHYHKPPQPVREVSKCTRTNMLTLERWVNKKMQEGEASDGIL